MNAAEPQPKKQQEPHKLSQHPAVDPNTDIRLELRLPSIWTLLSSPHLVVTWLFASIEGWVHSRNLSLLALGLPYLIAASALLFHLSAAPNGLREQIQQLRSETQQPKSLQDPGLHELRLRALAGLQPDNPQPLLQLALFFADENRFDEAVPLMQRLAAWGETGVPDARLWLVRDALSATPHQQLSKEAIEQHLQMVLRAAPTNVEAHASLAAIMLERGELLLGERSLAAAAELEPKYLLPLIQLRKSLGRANINEDTVREAIGKLQAVLTRRPGDAESRIAATRLLLMLSDFDTAEQLLDAGRKHEDLPILQRALAEARTLRAETRLNESTLYRDQTAEILASALALDPLNSRSVELADRLLRLDAQFSPKLIADTTAKWEEEFKRSPDKADVRLGLCRMLELNGQPKRSLELLQPLLANQPQLNSKAVELLMKSGDASAARAAAQSSLEAARQPSASTTTRLTAAECLLILEDFPEVLTLLKQPDGSLPTNPAEQFLCGIACLKHFDTLCARPKLSGPAADYWIPDFNRVNPEQIPLLLPLLHTAGSIPPCRLEAADRFARIALLDHPVSAEAETALFNIRARDNNSAEVLNQLGAHAILHARYDKATHWLEQGNRLTGAKNPAILNNLAICILRGKLDSNQRALLLVEEALTLLPDNPELLSTRGEIHVAMQNWLEARRDLEKSLAARSGRPKVHRLLETTYRNMQNPDRAEFHRSEAEKLETVIAEVSGN